MLVQEEKDQQWKRAMDYLSAVSELNYMTQIVIMLYEDNNKVVFDGFSLFLLCSANLVQGLHDIFSFSSNLASCLFVNTFSNYIF